MPTYEYECQKCGHRFEEFQSMKDAALTKCPKCKGKLKRLIGAGAGFLFKGSGFYTTDYRSSSYSDKKKKDAGAASPAAPAASSSSGDAGSSSSSSGKSSSSEKPSSSSKESKAPKKAKD